MSDEPREVDGHVPVLGAVLQERPWLRNRQWAAGVIRGKTGVFVCIALWGLALGIAAVAWALRGAMHSTTGAALAIPLQGLMAILLPAAALSLAGLAIQSTRVFLRFRTSTLTLENGIPAPGGAWSARVDCAVPWRRDAVFKVELRCRYSETGNSDPNFNRVESVLVEEYACHPLESLSAPHGSLIPIRFDLASVSPTTGTLTSPTGQARTPASIAWTLRVSCTMPGLDYHDEFAVPVFRNGAVAGVALRGRGALSEDLSRNVFYPVRVERRGDEVQVTFPPAMNTHLAVIPTALAAVAGWCAWCYAAAGLGLAFAISLLITLVCGYAMVRAWLLRTVVTAKREGVGIRRSILGLSWSRPYATTDDMRFPTDSSVRIGEVTMSKLHVSLGRRAHAFGSLLRSGYLARRISDLLSEAVHGRKP